MDLRELEYLLTVSECHSFTKAAARLHVSQSTLSVAVKKLERELSTLLLDRSTHHVELTEVGKAFAIEARKTLDAAQVARDVAAAAQDSVTGPLRVGVIKSIPQLDVAGLLAGFIRAYPKVEVIPWVSGGDARSPGRAASVLSHEVDVALDSLPYVLPGLQAHLIYSDPVVLARAKDAQSAETTPQDITDLTDHKFVETPQGFGMRAISDRLFASCGVRRSIVMEVPDVPTIIDLVRAGIGSALLPRSIVVADAALSAIPVRPHAEFAVKLLVPANRRLSAATRAFVDFTLARYEAKATSLQETPTEAIRSETRTLSAS